MKKLALVLTAMLLCSSAIANQDNIQSSVDKGRQCSYAFGFYGDGVDHNPTASEWKNQWSLLTKHGGNFGNCSMVSLHSYFISLSKLQAKEQCSNNKLEGYTCRVQ